LQLKPDPSGSMREIRTARLADLDVVASWISDASECELWAGPRVAFPIDLPGLPAAIEWNQSDSWSVVVTGDVAAFGQLVPKPRRRAHVARLITSPRQRGQGLGRLLAVHLLENAISRNPGRVSLDVSPANDAAIGLYRSLGFLDAPRPADEPVSSAIYMEHAD
jgi:ribosomal protein S18 acetylase RimI-like enzyme